MIVRTGLVVPFWRMLTIHIPSASGTPPPGVDATSEMFDSVVQVDWVVFGDTVPVPAQLDTVMVYSYASDGSDVQMPEVGDPVASRPTDEKPLLARDQVPSLRIWNVCEPAALSLGVK